MASPAASLAVAGGHRELPVRKGRGKLQAIDVTVIMGDPRLPDQVKRGGAFNPEDLETVEIPTTSPVATIDRAVEFFRGFRQELWTPSRRDS